MKTSNGIYTYIDGGEVMAIKKRNQNSKWFPRKFFPISITDSIKSNWSGRDYSYLSNVLIPGVVITSLNIFNGEKSNIQKDFEKDFDFIENVTIENFTQIDAAGIEENEERRDKLHGGGDGYNYGLRWRIQKDMLFNSDYNAEKPTEVTIKVKAETGEYHGHKKQKKVKADEYFLITESKIVQDGHENYKVTPIKIYVTDKNIYIIHDNYGRDYNPIISKIKQVLETWVYEVIAKQNKDIIYDLRSKLAETENKLNKLEKKESEKVEEPKLKISEVLQEIEEKEKATN